MKEEPIGNVGESVSEKKKKEPFKIHKTEFVYIFMIAIVAAFFGWVAENIVRMISLGIFDNRYHFLPFIFPYAIAVFAMYLALETPNDVSFFGKPIFKKVHKWQKFLNHIMYIQITSAFVFLGELAVGWFYEATTGLSLWDYTNLPLHFTKYTGFIPALGYGFGAYLMMLLFNPLLKFIKKHFTYKSCLIICWSLGLLIILDNLIMITTTLVGHCKPEYWRICIRDYCEPNPEACVG